MVIQNDCPCFEVSFGESSVLVSPTEASQFVLTKLLGNIDSCNASSSINICYFMQLILLYFEFPKKYFELKYCFIES